MFVTHFDTIPNTIAIGNTSHFAYIFYFRAQIKGNKKRKSSGKSLASLHQDDTCYVMSN